MNNQEWIPRAIGAVIFASNFIMSVILACLHRRIISSFAGQVSTVASVFVSWLLVSLWNVQSEASFIVVEYILTTLLFYSGNCARLLEKQALLIVTFKCLALGVFDTVLMTLL